MSPQFVFVHGIMGAESKLPYDELARALGKRLPEAGLHLADWRELGFTTKRPLLDIDRPFNPPLETVLRQVQPPLLSERACVWLDILERDVCKQHPLWFPTTAMFKAELAVLRWLLDYVADIEVYLRDDERRAAIQEYVRRIIARAAESGPTIVVAHSLGSVICHEVIHAMAPDSVCLLVTLGSPLQFMLYQLHGTGLVTFGLLQHPKLDWLNVHDIKDVLASPLVQDDFVPPRRVDFYVHWKLIEGEVGFIAFQDGRAVSFEEFWQEHCPGTGLRANVAINRYSSALLAHQSYWQVSARYRALVETLVAYATQLGSARSPETRGEL